MKKIKSVFLIALFALGFSTVGANNHKATVETSEDAFRCKIVHKENGVKIKVVADTCEEAIEAIKILTQ